MKTRILKASSAICTAALMAATPALAEDIRLLSADGTVDLVGEFIDFKDNAYIVRTALGELRLSAERVRCEGDACPDFADITADVTIAGSDTVGLGMMPLLLEGFAGNLDAEATISTTSAANEIVASMVGDGGFGDELGSYLVTSSASGDAFAKLMDKSAQIGMASRRIRPEEARALRDTGAGNMVSPQNEHIIAVDSIVVIVNPQNGIDRLSLDQVAAIYAGEITNWSEVGGADMPITVVGRQADSGTSAVFFRTITGEDNNFDATDDMIVAEDNNSAAAIVNSTPGALGFVGYAFQRGAKPLSLVNACGLTMTPDAFSARTEEYELQRRLYLYNRTDELNDSTQSFLDYAQSPAADAVIRKAGFIDLGVASQEQSLDGDRARMLLDPSADVYEGGVMREMLSVMVDFDRLSTTFRFRTGSSSLDERGLTDLERLTAYLDTVPDGASIMAVGFTDDVGSFDANRDLSYARASQVLDELRAYAGAKLDRFELASTGFGEVAPSGCNTFDYGRAINRRVEIWIKSNG